MRIVAGRRPHRSDRRGAMSRPASDIDGWAWRVDRIRYQGPRGMRTGGIVDRREGVADVGEHTLSQHVVRVRLAARPRPAGADLPMPPLSDQAADGAGGGGGLGLDGHPEADDQCRCPGVGPGAPVDRAVPGAVGIRWGFEPTGGKAVHRGLKVASCRSAVSIATSRARVSTARVRILAWGSMRAARCSPGRSRGPGASGSSGWSSPSRSSASSGSVSARAARGRSARTRGSSSGGSGSWVSWARGSTPRSIAPAIRSSIATWR